MPKQENSATGRMGRPRKKPDQGKRVSVMFRLGEMIRDQVMAQAQNAGRSMSEEIERRVEGSLSADTRVHSMKEMIGGSEMIMFVSLITGTLRIAIRAADSKINNNKEWYEDPEKVDFVMSYMQNEGAKAVDMFAGMLRTGTAQRAGEHLFKPRD